MLNIDSALTRVYAYEWIEGRGWVEPNLFSVLVSPDGSDDTKPFGVTIARILQITPDKPWVSNDKIKKITIANNTPDHGLSTLYFQIIDEQTVAVLEHEFLKVCIRMGFYSPGKIDILIRKTLLHHLARVSQSEDDQVMRLCRLALSNDSVSCALYFHLYSLLARKSNVHQAVQFFTDVIST